ncbi:frizzled-9 [Aplysia californica]|uniref:Frizzled-9 n=1 Tax=Aplysia californica TaxID=6500 RepID=A0ABM1A201_APLCA|nr:frizzled-9 [Aplysia californica]
MSSRYLLLLLAVVLCGLGAVDSASALRLDGRYPRCEPITIKMCKDMRYNMTQMPNLAGQENQIEAEARIKDFIPLVQTGCSRLLQFFLCSLYAPMCTELVDETLIIPACRSMCLQVKAKCEPLLRTFNFDWPPMLACDKLPEKSDPRNDLCMAAPNVTDEPEYGAGTLSGGHFEEFEKKLDKLDGNKNWKKIIKERLNKKGGLIIMNPTTARTRLGGQKFLDKHQPIPDPCPPRFVHVDNIPRSNNTCAPRCDVDVLFREEDKNFAEIWMIVWASLCCFSTLLTVTTFIIDTTRFKYPERPIIFLSVCYFIQSAAYIIRVATGPESVSCDTARDGRPFLIQEGLDSTWCIIIFLLLYFFGMASAVWWVVLTITWFLAAGRKWGQEAIEALSSYFHLAAWAIPAAKTIVILTMRRVDGDELTGLCYVGNQDPDALTGFVLVPLCIYLVAGFAFILAGFAAMFRIRKDLKEDGVSANIRKLEKLMAKIGVFSVLYTVPATCVIGCHFYERVNFLRWRRRAMSLPCPLDTSNKLSPPVVDPDCPLEQSIPTVEVYMLKLFMSLVIGITSGMWIWSGKSLSSWKNFCSRRFTRRKTNNFNAEYHPAPVIMMKNSHQGNSSKIGSNSSGSAKVIASRV